ncbi:aldo/keto reductase [Candidatus Marsarchaeota G2 archaeon ECH_B_SAG-C16]|uniref:Aldo/keto reductase n=2 Tax=Candidatus Marsarchaeota group 2 TaxID=2203771 RepID=A0A2R6CDC9_9ARCH|nr:MAG: aldo/keto reductase [Candidatus Marsarchaeota G2 archaeon ECH_B_SAG-C16]PSO08903.1 MAG: aldo/keto reductase [Candidatus Marsarchaeota G2 archaeon BE_D]
MEYKLFAKSGVRVSAVGMGTYYDPLWIVTAYLSWRRGAQAKIQAIRSGIELGINLVDTAEIYQSEPLVAKAIAGLRREDVFLATKVWSNHLRRDKLIKSLESSMRRLGVSYVDLYQIHFPNPRVPIAETMGAMEEMVDKGKIRFIGVSNFSLEQMVEAQHSLKKYELSSTQMEYSLANRSIEKDILPYCERNGIAVLAYFPLAHGKLASNTELSKIGAKYGKTPSQVALNILASKPNVFPIPRASRVEHVRLNAESVGWRVSDEDKAKIEALFAG